MRITETETNAFIDILSDFLQDTKAELYLYGSRTQDNLKGGDIDLLLVVNETLKQQLTSVRHQILNRFKEKIGDQKIDLTICTKKSLKEEPFLQIIAESKKLIKTWQALKN